MTCYVRTLSNHFYRVDLKKKMTIGDLKQNVEKQSGIPSLYQRLVFGGEAWADDKQRVSLAGIVNDSTVYLIPCRTANSLLLPEPNTITNHDGVDPLHKCLLPTFSFVHLFHRLKVLQLALFRCKKVVEHRSDAALVKLQVFDIYGSPHGFSFFFSFCSLFCFFFLEFICFFAHG